MTLDGSQLYEDTIASQASDAVNNWNSTTPMSNTGTKSRIVPKFRALSFERQLRLIYRMQWTREPSRKSTYLNAWHSKGHSMSHHRWHFMMPHGSLASRILMVSIRLSSTDMSRQITGWMPERLAAMSQSCFSASVNCTLEMRDVCGFRARSWSWAWRGARTRIQVEDKWILIRT